MYQMNYKSSRFKTFVMCFSHVVCKRVFLVHWQALSLAQPLGSHNVEEEKKRREVAGLWKVPDAMAFGLHVCL